tara:strand:+ start:448 stop:1095 length:648 start_codon:yes stop_codon:yes gene_type:complete
MIAKEGRFILIPLLLITFPVGVYAYALEDQILILSYYALGILFLFTLYFFRDPIRKIPNEPSVFVSPADGKVFSIKTIDDNDIGDSSHVISIYLNIFNVHVNRFPFDGIVQNVELKSGKFLAAFNHNISEVNEQAITTVSHNKLKYKTKQIAGIFARRILCYAVPKMSVKKGDRLGFIRFGSRTDLVVPSSVNICVKEGDKVKGGETVLAKVKNE